MVSLQVFLSDVPGFIIAGTAKDGYEAFRLLDSVKPEIIILDLQGGFLAGTDIVPLLVKKSPRSLVIYFTRKEDETSVRAALANGVNGYLLKFDDLNKFQECIKVLRSGGIYINQKIAAKLFRSFSEILRKHAKRNAAPYESKGISDPVPPTISRTELLVISHVAQGHSTREIAGELRLKEGTVRNYVSSAMQKAGLHSRTQITLYAMVNGLVPSGGR
jgi:DNA-binding NarL/FixJ family response regulator